jgi:hypothetical protein
MERLSELDFQARLFFYYFCGGCISIGLADASLNRLDQFSLEGW